MCCYKIPNNTRHIQKKRYLLAQRANKGLGQVPKPSAGTPQNYKPILELFLPRYQSVPPGRPPQGRWGRRGHWQKINGQTGVRNDGAGVRTRCKKQKLLEEMVIWL